MARSFLWNAAKSERAAKRIGAAEFRNTHFSFTMCPMVEQFVSTPELHSENSIGSDPLPAGQVWALSPGALTRILDCSALK